MKVIPTSIPDVPLIKPQGKLNRIIAGDAAEFLCKTTGYRAPARGRCLAITWPLQVAPLVSARNQRGLALPDAGTFL